MTKRNFCIEKNITENIKVVTQLCKLIKAEAQEVEAEAVVSTAASSKTKQRRHRLILVFWLFLKRRT